MAPLGFEATFNENGRRADRRRADDFDADMVLLSVADDGASVTVVADVFDADSVNCRLAFPLS